jgi:hypothetical protein
MAHVVIAPRDRRAQVAASTLLNGIDFVEVVDPAETRLQVHFINKVPVKDSYKSATIDGGDTIPSVPITGAVWSVSANGFPLLDLTVASPGDFSKYTLTIHTAGPTLDLYFDHVEFSFKANCASTLDCETPPTDCAADDDPEPPIDLLAKDFDSFKRALSAFSAVRYPEWQEQSEADFGVMFMEALSALADDLSYQQDRIAAEAWIDTATERRSLVRLARLVDYEPPVATAARTLLRFDIAGDLGESIPPGLGVSAVAPDGSSVDFETGAGLGDTTDYPVHPSWNAITAYWFDDSEHVLECGATAMWVERPARTLVKGQPLLIETPPPPERAADQPLRHLVHVADLSETTDVLANKQLLHVTWSASEKLPSAHDLRCTTVAANLVPATHGRSFSETFVIPSDQMPVPSPPPAIARTGPNGTPQFLHTLRQAPLTWLASDDPAESAAPEILVTDTNGGDPRTWTFQRTLLRAEAFDEAFTIDPMRYRMLEGRDGFFDYDGSDGATIRFGDGAFGAIPAENAIFEVKYRAGGGASGNVAADALTRIDTSHPAAASVLAVSNPFAASGGQDEERASQVRDRAPYAFRATQYRAVLPADYERAATRLSWVQRAGTAFRYTGSWLSVRTAVDPRGSTAITDDQLASVSALLNRYRMAGYESVATAPRYASLDLVVVVCARADAFRSDVTRAVMTTLDAKKHGDGTTGFFYPDRFTFGTPLERSVLSAALQEVPGVDGIVELRYRRRGYMRVDAVMPDAITVAADEIIRCDGDADRPDRGSVRVEVRGGK